MVMTEEIREEIIEADAAQPPSPRRKRTLGIAAGAAILVAGIVAAVAVAQGGGDSSQPEITAAPASPSSDAFVRSLVESGAVPAASLDDGSQIAGKALDPTTQSQDEVVRNLVAQGFVPAASLDDGSQITGGARSRAPVAGRGRA